jgi:hypothetical protein
MAKKSNKAAVATAGVMNGGPVPHTPIKRKYKLLKGVHQGEGDVVYYSRDPKRNIIETTQQLDLIHGRDKFELVTERTVLTPNAPLEKPNPYAIMSDAELEKFCAAEEIDISECNGKREDILAAIELHYSDDE